jgi:hypothetical protein
VDVGNITVEHFIFIPGVFLVGLMVGFMFGAKAVRNEMARMKQRAKK